MNVGDLKKALEGVDDDVEVEFQSGESLFGYYTAHYAYETTTQVGLLLPEPETVKVFRIDGLGY